MIATYTLKENELDMKFINSIKEIFKGKPLSITITDETDETAYLLSNPSNRKQLQINIESSDQKVFRGDEFENIVTELSK